MDFLIVVGGIAFLCILFMLPKWIANVTGKTVHIRGRSQTFSTYHPDSQQEFLNRELQILEYPMSPEHTVQYLKTGNKDIINEYEKLSDEYRSKIESAIKMHPKNIINSNQVEEFYSDVTLEENRLSRWHVLYFMLNFKIKNLDYNTFYTLSINEKSSIKQFLKLYEEADILMKKNSKNY